MKGFKGLGKELEANIQDYTGVFKNKKFSSFA